MRVERRHFVDFAERQSQLAGERRQVRSSELSVAVLNEMQIFDQQIALPRLLAEQRADFRERCGIDLAAFRGWRRPATAAARLVDRNVNRPAPSSLSRGSWLHAGGRSRGRERPLGIA
jgi:hypothetical protein